MQRAGDTWQHQHTLQVFGFWGNVDKHQRFAVLVKTLLQEVSERRIAIWHMLVLVGQRRDHVTQTRQ